MTAANTINITGAIQTAFGLVDRQLYIANLLRALDNTNEALNCFKGSDSIEGFTYDPDDEEIVVGLMQAVTCITERLNVHGVTAEEAEAARARDQFI